MKIRNKIIVLLLSVIVIFQVITVDISAGGISDEMQNTYSLPASTPAEPVSNDTEPTPQEKLVLELEKITKQQGIGDSIKNTYSIDETVDILVNILGYEIENQSVIQGVSKEMISSVLFREMICYDILDKLGDGVVSKTMGISQISADGVRLNDKLVANKENIKPKYKDYSDQQLNTMLENNNLSVGFAATALKARAYRENIPIGSEDEANINKIFAAYNDYSGQILFVSNLGKKVGLHLKMPEIGPVQYKETYGKETYEYYQAFKAYYQFL